MRPPRITPEAIEQAWTVMGLAPGATAAEIKSAYRALARQFHPDVAADADARAYHEKMVAINAAYRLLMAARGDIPADTDEDIRAYEKWWWERFGEGPV